MFVHCAWSAVDQFRTGQDVEGRGADGGCGRAQACGFENRFELRVAYLAAFIDPHAAARANDIQQGVGIAIFHGGLDGMPRGDLYFWKIL